MRYSVFVLSLLIHIQGCKMATKPNFAMVSCIARPTKDRSSQICALDKVFQTSTALIAKNLRNRARKKQASKGLTPAIKASGLLLQLPRQRSLDPEKKKILSLGRFPLYLSLSLSSFSFSHNPQQLFPGSNGDQIRTSEKKEWKLPLSKAKINSQKKTVFKRSWICANWKQHKLHAVTIQRIFFSLIILLYDISVVLLLS